MAEAVGTPVCVFGQSRRDLSLPPSNQIKSKMRHQRIWEAMLQKRFDLIRKLVITLDSTHSAATFRTFVAGGLLIPVNKVFYTFFYRCMRFKPDPT